MNQVKLCMLDEPLEQEKLRSLISVCPEIIAAKTKDLSLLESERGFQPLFSHGTLCMAVLIEALQKFGLLQNVELYHFSIGFIANRRSEHALLEGLEYCAECDIDIVSCSVGLLQRLWATPIISFLHQREKPLVIAAAANNQHITYPAALPSVLGVKISEGPPATPCSVAAPPDGIDLLARCSESKVLDKIGYDFSNSILAPQICAQAAKHLLRGVLPEKEAMLTALTNGAQIKSSEKPVLIGSVDSDDDPPVVLLPHSDESYVDRFHLAVQFQQKFEESDYSCAVLSDRLEAADFETGHFPVDPQYIDRDISYYVHITEYSLFLLVAEQSASCDLRLDEDEMSADQIQQLFNKILAAFPDS